MPGRGTTDAIFILRQLQEQFLHKNKQLYFVFVDLEKAFDRVPRKVLWWAMRKIGLEEWIVRLVQALYDGTKCRVRVNGKLGQPFDVQVGLHQGSVLSPLLFIIVLEALSKEFRTGSPWELLYQTANNQNTNTQQDTNPRIIMFCPVLPQIDPSAQSNFLVPKLGLMYPNI